MKNFDANKYDYVKWRAPLGSFLIMRENIFVLCKVVVESRVELYDHDLLDVSCYVQCGVRCTITTYACFKPVHLCIKIPSR
jgi:hypothetical protein